MISIRYKCRCMAKEAAVDIRDREDGEDIIRWMNCAVQPGLGEDHRRRSPSCRASKTEYVKIPARENAPFLGGKPELHG